MDERLHQFRSEVRDELDRILIFWSEIMPDRERGGFYGRVDGSGKLFPDADRGVILNTRILWTYVAAFSQTGVSAYLRLAHVAFDYIIQHFWDDENGGVYWMVNCEGEVVDAQKQIYAQAFAIYAFAEYFAVTKNALAKEKAIHLYHLIERHSRDKVRGGYFNVFNADWTLKSDQKLSDKDEDQAKIMNTHLHILEAYSNLYRAIPHDDYARTLRRILKVYVGRFCSGENGHLTLYFDEEWRPSSHEISFGHDIESSWLIWEAAERLKDPSPTGEVRDYVLSLVQATISDGLDEQGGVFEKTGSNGRDIEKEKHWWPQAEAVVAFLNAYQMTSEDKYLTHMFNSWEFIKRHFLDLEKGEWHWLIDAKGHPVLSEDKVGPWKAPYHNSRMCIEVLKRLG